MANIVFASLPFVLTYEL